MCAWVQRAYCRLLESHATQKHMHATRVVVLAALAVFVSSTARAATLVGPTPYLSQGDSPFVANGMFQLDDFEDNALNTPGVTPSAGSVIAPGSITDSVDADDGATDGSGTGGHSFFSGNGAAGIRFDFDAGALGALPTAAGIVWTDGEGSYSFEAFNAMGASLGTLGPFPAAGSVDGDTAEDRFFGVYEAGGISAILISNTLGGIEVDHLQYGAATLATTTTTTPTGESTTTTVTGSSTTTTLPTGCANVPVGPTFASLNCRLAALIAQVAASPDLGTPRQEKISKSLSKAKLRKEGAETKCTESKLQSVKGQLAKAVLRIVGVKKTLGQPAARREVPAALRVELTTTLNALQADLRTLRKSVRCPDDATS
jgi:hypothetical protein